MANDIAKARADRVEKDKAAAALIAELTKAAPELMKAQVLADKTKKELADESDD